MCVDGARRSQDTFININELSNDLLNPEHYLHFKRQGNQDSEIREQSQKQNWLPSSPRKPLTNFNILELGYTFLPPPLHLLIINSCEQLLKTARYTGSLSLGKMPHETNNQNIEILLEMQPLNFLLPESRSAIFLNAPACLRAFTCEQQTFATPWMQEVSQQLFTFLRFHLLWSKNCAVNSLFSYVCFKCHIKPSSVQVLCYSRPTHRN